MTNTVYVPIDSAATSVGATAVALAITAEARRRDIDIRLVRNGSRGLLWLEPLVEVETVEGRVGYGPVTAADVAALFDSDFLTGADNGFSVGIVEDIPWLADQQRVTFARVGVIDPLDINDYEAHGGLTGLRTAIALGPSKTVEEVLASGLRGRGGAGFPAGIKWRTVLEAESGQKYVCCNADEGDSGTFADRMLMEGDPFTLIEGMAIAGIAGGATKGLIYIRSEYPDAIATMRAALLIARGCGLLGDDVLGSGKAFDISVRVGAGSYVCGEETAMLESLEGKRGMVRAKPPIPALHGLFGEPTIVNNVLTLGTVPMILAQGAAAYQALGADRSRGTQVFQLAGNIARGGIVERAFGISLKELVETYGVVPAPVDPFDPFRWAGPWVPISRPVHWMWRWITKRCSPPAACWGTVGLLSSMTRSIWPNRRALPWNSARRSPAASARRVAWARCAGPKSSTRSSITSIETRTWNYSTTCAT